LVERKTPVAVLLVAVVVLGAGYAVGRYSPPIEQVTTTTTWTTTQSSYAFVTVTELKTTTVTTTLSSAVGEPPESLPPPANSSAVIRSRLLLNGSLFLLVSIDKPVYRMGETVHFKGTLTNLTPNRIALQMEFPSVRIRNSRTVVTYPGSPSVWMKPRVGILGGLGNTWFDDVTVEAGETVTVDMFTADWNMTGIHGEHSSLSGVSSAWVAYDDHPVPPDLYNATWNARMRILDRWDEEVAITIPFKITG
jgi:hypothetical protein